MRAVCAAVGRPGAADGAGARGRGGQRLRGGELGDASPHRGVPPRQIVARNCGGYTASCPEGRSCSRRRQGAR